MKEGRIPKELYDKYPSLHFCPNWDLLLIEENDPEFECCTCGFPKKNVQEG